MKKLLIACLILFVVFLLCFGSIFLLFRKEVSDLFKKLKNNFSGETTAILLIDSGDVMVKSSESAEYEKAYDEQELFEGAYIKTAESSESHLVLANNSIISLDQNTEIKITEMPTEKENDTFIEQFAGNAWHRVGELTGGNYEVETPNTIAAVRGTILGIGVLDDGTDEIFSIENDVSVGQKEIVDGVKKVVNEKIISSDNYTKIQNIDDADGFEVVSTPLEVKSSEWFTYNRDLDEIFENFDYKNLGSREDLIKKYRDENGGGGLLDGIIPDASDISPVTSVYGESGDTCRELEGINIDETLALFDEFESYFSFGFSADELRAFYSDLDEMCADGYITNQEAQQLSSDHTFLQGN